MPSLLDLTGQASEDEPISRYNNSHTASSATTRDPRIDSLLTFLPCPIDLYRTFTPLSLFLLPFVFLIYIILGLPLHFNSCDVSETIHTIDEPQWRERVASVGRMEGELSGLKGEVRRQRSDQVELRKRVGCLKKRLERVRERRERRVGMDKED